MPCEILKIHMKPVNFFDRNPGLDVPPSQQAFNKSTAADQIKHQQAGTVEGVVQDGCCDVQGTAGVAAKLQKAEIS